MVFNVSHSTERQGPGCPAKNRISITKTSEQQIKDAVKTPQPVKRRKLSSANRNIIAHDLQEAGPSGVQAGGRGKQDLGTHTPNNLVSETELPPRKGYDVDDATWDAVEGLLVLSGQFALPKQSPHLGGGIAD